MKKTIISMFVISLTFLGSVAWADFDNGPCLDFKTRTSYLDVQRATEQGFLSEREVYSLTTVRNCTEFRKQLKSLLKLVVDRASSGIIYIPPAPQN